MRLGQRLLIEGRSPDRPRNTATEKVRVSGSRRKTRRVDSEMTHIGLGLATGFCTAGLGTRSSVRACIDSSRPVTERSFVSTRRFSAQIKGHGGLTEATDPPLMPTGERKVVDVLRSLCQ